VAAGVAGLASAALAACGSAGAPAGGSAASGGAVPASHGTAGGSGAAGCTGKSLTVSVGLAQVGAAAGSSLYPIDITNHSAASCRLDGYPAAWLADKSGSRIGAEAAPDKAVAPHAVPLAPGGSAHVWLQVGTAANYPPGKCHPVTSHLLVVRVADGGPATNLQLALPACAGSLPAPGLLLVQPFAPGRGKQGTAG
jgi:hypothetical protein